MNKKLFLFSFLALAGALVLSCRKEGPASTTITFWHFWGEPRQKAAMTDIVKNYEASHPGVNIVMTELSWNDGKTKLLAAFNSGTAPDVLELGSDWCAQFSSAGVLAETEDILAERRDRYLPFALAPTSYNDKTFCLPWVVDTRVMFFNKTLLKKIGNDPSKPPATWSDLLEAVKKISGTGSGVYGFGANATDPHRLYKKVLPFFWANGGSILNDDGTAAELVTQENLEALNYYLGLCQYGMLETQKQLDEAFLAGKIGFWISGAWLIDKIAKENSALEYGIMLMPQPSENRGQRSSFAGGEYLAVNAKSKQIPSAKDFASYLSDGATAFELCKKIKEAGYPAEKKYLDEKFYTDDPLRSVFTAQLASSQMPPIHPKWLELESVLEEAIANALYHKATAEQALTDAENKMNVILSQ